MKTGIGDGGNLFVDSGVLRPYKYPELRGPHQIRLFEIHPEGEHGQENFHGHLIRSNLLWGPSYDAISYTWADENGDSTKTRKIYLLDQRPTVTVTSSCITVLKHLRHQTKRRLVWIDGICIDQESDLERTHQVSLMARIYKSANKVIAYTGDATEESDELFDWVNAVHPKDLLLPIIPGWACFLDTGGQARAPSTEQVMAGLDKIGYHLSVLRHKASFYCCQWWPVRLGRQATADHATSLSDKQVIDAAIEHFSRRYYQRVWILQEVSLPDPRRIVMKCGTKSTSAERAMHLLSLISSDGPDALPIARSFPVLTGNRKIMRPAKSHLLDLLIETRDRYCSEPRDKIFGILSVANWLDEGRYPELVADYELSIAQVYACYSKFFIHYHGIAFFWSLIKSSHAVPNLPSWSADWSVPWPNYKAVCGRHLPATSKNNDRLDPSVSFELDHNNTGEILKIILRTVTRGVFTRDGHLDGVSTTTTTVEQVVNLQQGHHLVELHPGVCALLREICAHHELYYEFIQVCPHHLEVDGLHQIVDAWPEYVVDGKIAEFGDVAGSGERHGYLSGLITYYIR